MSNIENKTPTIQFVRNSNSVFSSSGKAATTHYASTSLVDKCKETIGSELWNDQDTIEIFTLYEDGSYVLEKSRSVYDWKLKRVHQYKYLEDTLTESQLKILEQNFLDLYEVCHVNYIQKTQKEVQDLIKTEFGLIKYNISTTKNVFLSETDWTQLPDNDLSDEQREEFKLYRQKLRDITKTESWIAGEYINAIFPIPPAEYHKMYPNGEVGYLETDDQFNPEAIVMLKKKLLRFAHTLGLQSTSLGFDLAEIDAAVDAEDMDKVALKVNQVLKYIDASFEIVLRETVEG